MKGIKQVFSFFIIMLLFGSQAFALSSDQADVQKAYQAWCSAIGTAHGHAQDVVKYYAPNAILLPTLSPKMLVNVSGGLDAYFTKFTEHSNIKCKTQQIITTTFHDVAINSGFYTFNFDKEGKTVSIPARFTFVYRKVDGNWLIVNHHSSMLPNE